MFSLLYAVAPSYQIILALVLVHGVFWSGLLSSSSSYIIDIVPKSRRAEGLGYSGFASILAVAVAPWIGLYVFDHGGWRLVCVESAILNIIMAVIAWRLPPDKRHDAREWSLHPADLVEWRVLIGAVTLFLYSFSYGGITSFVAVYAEQVGVPRALYFTAFSLAILCTRPFIGRYADRIGHTRLIVPCLVMIVIGIAVLSIATDPATFVASALLFGVGFGSAYPVFVAHLMHHVAENRRTRDFRRDDRRVRHRHRHRLDRRRLDQRALRIRPRLWRRRCAGVAVDSVFPLHGEAPMDYVRLGTTGLKVSRLCLGTMTYGTPAWRPWVLDEEASRPFLKRASNEASTSSIPPTCIRTASASRSSAAH